MPRRRSIAHGKNISVTRQQRFKLSRKLPAMPSNVCCYRVTGGKRRAVQNNSFEYRTTHYYLLHHHSLSRYIQYATAGIPGRGRGEGQKVAHFNKLSFCPYPNWHLRRKIDIINLNVSAVAVSRHLTVAEP